MVSESAAETTIRILAMFVLLSLEAGTESSRGAGPGLRLPAPVLDGNQPDPRQRVRRGTGQGVLQMLPGRLGEPGESVPEYLAGLGQRPACGQEFVRQVRIVPGE